MTALSTEHGLCISVHISWGRKASQRGRNGSVGKYPDLALRENVPVEVH